MLLRRVPGGVNRLFAVKRIFSGNALAPTLRTIGMQRHQQDAAFGSAAEAGLEEMHQRHADFAQGDGFNLHSAAPPAGPKERSSSHRPRRNAPLPAASRS